jgi:hypothetical protein
MQMSKKIKKLKKYIILVYFQVKNTLINNYYYNFKHALIKLKYLYGLYQKQKYFRIIWPCQCTTPIKGEGRNH